MKKRFSLCMLIGFFTVATIFYSGCTHKERVKESTTPRETLPSAV